MIAEVMEHYTMPGRPQRVESVKCESVRCGDP